MVEVRVEVSMGITHVEIVSSGGGQDEMLALGEAPATVQERARAVADAYDILRDAGIIEATQP